MNERSAGPHVLFLCYCCYYCGQLSSFALFISFPCLSFSFLFLFSLLLSFLFLHSSIFIIPFLHSLFLHPQLSHQLTRGSCRKNWSTLALLTPHSIHSFPSAFTAEERIEPKKTTARTYTTVLLHTCLFFPSFHSPIPSLLTLNSPPSLPLLSCQGHTHSHTLTHHTRTLEHYFYLCFESALSPHLRRTLSLHSLRSSPPFLFPCLHPNLSPSPVIQPHSKQIPNRNPQEIRDHLLLPPPTAIATNIDNNTHNLQQITNNTTYI